MWLLQQENICKEFCPSYSIGKHPYGSLGSAIRDCYHNYLDIKIMRNQRRIGEALMIASGIGVAVGGFSLGIMSLAYGGLAIAGLGIF